MMGGLNLHSMAGLQHPRGSRAAPRLRPNNLLVELTTSRFQSPDQLFFRGERQLVLACQNLIYEVAECVVCDSSVMFGTEN